MRNRPNAIVSFIMLLIAACSKEDRQVSVWYINDERFSTDEATMSIDKPGFHLSFNKSNGFSFYKKLSTPTVGTHILSANYESNDPALYRAYFYYNGIGYKLLPGQADTINIERPNGKYRISLNPGWFVNTANASDSVLIYGVFNEP